MNFIQKLEEQSQFEGVCHEEIFANEKAIARREPLKMRDRRASALAIKKSHYREKY